MVEGRHSIIKVKDQLTTVVELHDGRSAVLPYPGDMVESCHEFANSERHTNYKWLSPPPSPSLEALSPSFIEEAKSSNEFWSPVIEVIRVDGNFLS